MIRPHGGFTSGSPWTAGENSPYAPQYFIVGTATSGGSHGRTA